MLLFAAFGVTPKAAELSDIASRHWLKLEAPGMTIVTDASEAKLRTWAREIELFRRGLGLVLQFPVRQVDNGAVIYLFRSEGAMKPFLPSVDGKPVRAAAFFTTQLDRNTGVVCLGGSRFDTRERIFHEVTHWYLQQAGIRLPLWFEEGLAQVFQTFTLDGKNLRLGHANLDAFHHVRIAGTPPLRPLIETQELDYSKSSFKHGRTDLFYAQSWALSHLLLFGSPGSIGKAPQYIAALQQGLPPADAFAKGFGMSLEAVHKQLDVHIRSPRWFMLERPIDRNNLPTYTVSTLLGSELDVYMAALLLAGEHRGPAEKLVARLLEAEPDNPRAWELQVLAGWNGEGELPDSVTRPLLRAYELGSRNPVICSMLGFLAKDGRLADGSGPNALAFFRDAMRSRPGFPLAYRGMASLALSRPDPSVELRQELLNGLALSPNDIWLNLATSHCYMTEGNTASAQFHLQRLLAAHPDLPFEVRMHVQKMQALIQGLSP